MPNRIPVDQQRAEAALRLDRIENKIDKLSEAIVLLARAEEKIHILSAFSKQQSEQITGLGDKLDRLERVVETNANTVQTINKLFWAIVMAIVTSGIGIYLN